MLFARYAGLPLGAITQGSRTRPGLHAFARYAGLPRCSAIELVSGPKPTRNP